MATLEEMAADVIKTVTPAILMNYANRVEEYYPTVIRQEDLKQISQARLMKWKLIIMLNSRISGNILHRNTLLNFYFEMRNSR